MTLSLTCKSEINPQEHPVNLIDTKNDIYMTHAMDWHKK